MRKSQLTGDPGARRFTPNIRLMASFCGFSTALVRTSHMRKFTVPCVDTMTTSSSRSPSTASSALSLMRAFAATWLTKPAEKVALPEWVIVPLKSEGIQTTTSEVEAETSREKRVRCVLRH